MIKVLFVFGLIFSASSANSCWKIKDKDSKAYCESRYENKKSCWRIKNKDLRYQCESENGKNVCWKIKDKNKKIFCEAEYKQYKSHKGN